jgi:hypothetical protein
MVVKQLRDETLGTRPDGRSSGLEWLHAVNLASDGRFDTSDDLDDGGCRMSDPASFRANSP